MKPEIIVVLLLGLFSYGPAWSASDSCQKWFKNGELKQGNGCLLKCASLMTDMATFDCHDQCDELCRVGQGAGFLFKLSDLYPGLTPEEKALVAESPVQVLKAYELSWEAEILCKQDYEFSQRNDASDACRHYMWASLLNRELGHDFASKILNAHEQEPLQPLEEKAMDLANNRRGLEVSDKMLKEKRLTDENLRTAFRDDLDHGRLVVLKKRLLPGGKP